MIFGTFYRGYQTLSLRNEPAVYTRAVKLTLKWEPHAIQLCFPMFTTGMDSQRPGQLLLTSSALQPAVENMPEYNDQ
jgi:hypothetical protein